jgi:hypothetical protein
MVKSIKKMQNGGGKLSMSSPDSLYKSIQLKRDSLNVEVYLDLKRLPKEWVL